MSNTQSDYLHWPKSEYLWRWERIQRLIEQENLDAVLATNGANFHYITGGIYGGYSLRREAVIVPRDGHPITLCHNSKLPLFEAALYNEVRGFSSVEGIPYSAIMEVLKELNLERGRIGTELEEPFASGCPYAFVEGLKKHLPAVSFASSSKLMARAREIKSKNEISAHRRAAEIVDSAHLAVPELVKKAVTLRDLGELLERHITNNGGYVPYAGVRDGTTQKAGGGVSGVGLRTPNANRKISNGFLMIDLGTTFNSYWSDFDRHYWVGPLPEDARMQAKALVEGMKAGLKYCRPGVKAPEVVDVIYSAFEEYGIPKTERERVVTTMSMIAHGLGVELAEWPLVSLQPFYVDRPLEAGMVFALEPTFFTQYGRWTGEADIAITESGNELLSKSPMDLVVVAQ